MEKRKMNHWLNLTEIIKYAFMDIWRGMWEFLLKRQNRFHHKSYND
ncbi:MAG: hypothetical protein AAF789_09675 [Bacteroidota bacterium]